MGDRLDSSAVDVSLIGPRLEVSQQRSSGSASVRAVTRDH